MAMALDEASLRKEWARYQSIRDTPAHRAVHRKKEPLVSVIIPTYNRASMLRERSLKSVLGQSYRNLEVLVIGDACDDDTAGAVASFKDPRVRFVNLEGRPDYLSKGGWYCLAVRPMNHGLELATGDFITGLDDDDEYVPDRIERLVSLAQKHEADFIFHSFLFEISPKKWVKIVSADGQLKFATINNSTVFYHRFFKDLPYDWDCWNAWKEPADWNRFRKLGLFKPRQLYIHDPLLVHYLEGTAGFGNGGGGGLAKLNLYCGQDRLKGWVNVDPRTEARSDLKADPSRELPIADGGADTVLCPSPPALGPEAAQALLAECSRALKPGGGLYLNPGLLESAFTDVRAGMKSLGFMGVHVLEPERLPAWMDAEAVKTLTQGPCWQAMRFSPNLLAKSGPAGLQPGNAGFRPAG